MSSDCTSGSILVRRVSYQQQTRLTRYLIDKTLKSHLQRHCTVGRSPTLATGRASQKLYLCYFVRIRLQVSL